MSNGFNYQTREEYLVQAVEELRPVFASIGYGLPNHIRVACGFPLDAKRTKALGQYFPASLSKDGSHQVFISPKLDKPVEVIEALIHRLAQAHVGTAGQASTFQVIVRLMLLKPMGVGRNAWAVTKGESNFAHAYESIIDSLGEYPNSELDWEKALKKQGTRMLKATCPSCEYHVRLTKSMAGIGMPTCPCGDTLSL